MILPGILKSMILNCVTVRRGGSGRQARAGRDILSLYLSLLEARVPIHLHCPDEKTVSTSGEDISINSNPIFKNPMRCRSAKEFPTICDLARLCSFNRLEVMIKKMIFVLQFLLTDKFDLYKKPCQLLEVISQSILNRL